MTVVALPRFCHVQLIVFLAVTLAALAPLRAQPTLQITSPANGAIFSPGQTIAVSVSPSGSGFSFIAIIGQGPLGVTAPVYTPPYQFSIPIPTTITPAQYTLTAMGVISPGQSIMSAPITVVVQRPDPPVSVRVQPSILKLNIGKNAYLRVIGTYSDGSTADLTQAASTTFVSNSPAIATVTAQGAVTAVSSGSTTILVNGTVLVPVTVAPAAKIAPPQKALYASQSQQFYPTLADASVPSVSWSLNPSLGSVSGTGLYTAPSSITSQQAVVLAATSTSNNTISAQSTITLLPQLAMSLSPSSVNLLPSQTVQFYASLSNTVNYGLNWSINPNVGQIGILGLYTAPASITSAQAVTVKATSTVDGTTAATATINLLLPAANVTSQVSISATGVSLNRATHLYSQTVTITNNGSALTAAAYVLDFLEAGVTMVSPNGTTSAALPAGSPYTEVGAIGAGAIVTFTIQFNRVGTPPITYTPRVLGPGPR